MHACENYFTEASSLLRVFHSITRQLLLVARGVDMATQERGTGRTYLDHTPPGHGGPVLGSTGARNNRVGAAEMVRGAPRADAGEIHHSDHARSAREGRRPVGAGAGAGDRSGAVRGTARPGAEGSASELMRDRVVRRQRCRTHARGSARPDGRAYREILTTVGC